MYWKLITAILCGIVVHASAQPQVPAVPVRNRATVVLPSGLQLLPAPINSASEESAPLVSADGNTLYFSRRRHQQNYGPDKADDIWVSKKNSSGNWSRPVNVGGPLNNIYANTAVALDPSDQVIYLLNSYDQAGEGVAWARREGRSWSNPELCTIEDFYTIGDGATFHLGPNGNALLMALERQEGQGRRDLYVSFRRDGYNWSAPLNLGDVINTPKEEAHAFLAADGITLYFASRGHSGRGGFDLFYSRRLDDSWTNWSDPQNLGEEINTPYDDEYISMPATGDPAYLVYRDTNSHNIYTAHLPEKFRPEPVTLVRGKVNLPDSRPLNELQVTRLDLQSKRSPRDLPLDSEGFFTVLVPPGEEFGLQVEAPGYPPLSTYLQGQGPIDSSDTDQGVLLAATDFSPEYLKRDGEINNLRLRLDEMDEEMSGMLRQREAYLEELKKNTPREYRPIYSDPELDALRHRYEVLNRPVIIDTVPLPKAAEWESAIPEIDARRGTVDDELAEMKKRFNNFYQPEPGSDQREESDEFLWEEAKGFADFQHEIHDRMLEEMRPVISRELTQELWPQVRASVQEGMNPALTGILDEKEYEIREQIVQQLEDAAIHVGQSKIEMPAWQGDLEAELRGKMQEQVRMELQQELREDVRTALTNEAYLQLRRQEAEALHEQLKEKIDLQIREEQALTLAASRGQDLAVRGISQGTLTYREENRELVLLSPVEGAVFTLNNVFFKPNTAELKEISTAELDEVVEFLIAHQQIRVEIAAHTNGWLSHSVSLQLSEQRARQVADYLVSHGVAAEQVQYQGYGKTKPVASNDTLDGRRKNQRVELHILAN